MIGGKGRTSGWNQVHEAPRSLQLVGSPAQLVQVGGSDDRPVGSRVRRLSGYGHHVMLEQLDRLKAPVHP